MFNAKSREELQDFLKNDNHLRYIFNQATGTGKTFCSLLKMEQWNNMFGGEFLVVVPKKNIINGWKFEFDKFGYNHLLEKCTIICYNSLHKYVDKEWTGVFLDEAHHLSDKRKEMFLSMKYKCLIAMSATIGRDIKNFLYLNVRGLERVEFPLKDAIENGVLPNPKVVLIPLKLDNKILSEIYVKNPKAKKSMEVAYQDRFKCRDKSVKYNIHCTQLQWYIETNSVIKWLNQHAPKFAYLKKCGERLKWLSDKKTDFVKDMLKLLKDQRIITFCNSIEQSNELGKNSINSKNPKYQDIIDKFNSHKLHRITCIEILTEGANLVDCKISIFATLNGSERLGIQKMGRGLRHDKPVMIIPYYINTRDEEIVQKMIQNYDPNMIVKINDLNELKEHLK